MEDYKIERIEELEQINNELKSTIEELEEDSMVDCIGIDYEIAYDNLHQKHEIIMNENEELKKALLNLALKL